MSNNLNKKDRKEAFIRLVALTQKADYAAYVAYYTLKDAKSAEEKFKKDFGNLTKEETDELGFEYLEG